MTFVLTICTAGWLMCGSLVQYEFKDYQSCAAERKAIIESVGAGKFNYITCTEKKEIKK